MLIRSLHAENFRKYQSLKVDDIPQKGVITVAGLNESGKTSIGEAICFALYGRTFVLDNKNLYKIISWGADLAEVTLKFSDGEGVDYTLYRSLNRDDGRITVMLERNGSQDSILDTEKEVEDALLKILGFDYDAFSNSFYLAQRELTTPNPESDTIKKMAGIGDYARIHDEFLLSIEKRNETVSELSPDIESNQIKLDAMDLDETWLPELIDAEQTLGNEQKQREIAVSALDDNITVYENNEIKYSSVKKRRGFFSVMSFILLPLSVVLWGLFLGGKYFPERLVGLLNSFDEGVVEKFNTFSDNWLLPIAIFSVLALFVSLFARMSASSQMLRLSESAKDIVKIIQKGHDHVTSQVESLLPERVVQAMQKRSKTDPLMIIPPREQFANIRQLTEDAPDYKAKPEEITAAISRLSSSIKKQSGEIEDLGKGLLEDINQEKVRSDEAGVLRSTIKKLATVVSKCQREIDVNNIAIGLLQRAAISSTELFNKNIAEISANTLPKFTEGRYSRVSIAEDLSVKVYSDDKKGYMDFDEISSGTQRQIMLALRMAMSEELATNTGNKEQFIFLDEPFAFFDQKRTKSTLKALPDVSRVISQVWVVAQEFPADVEVEKAIVCPLESAELQV